MINSPTVTGADVDPLPSWFVLNTVTLTFEKGEHSDVGTLKVCLQILCIQVSAWTVAWPQIVASLESE